VAGTGCKALYAKINSTIMEIIVLRNVPYSEGTVRFICILKLWLCLRLPRVGFKSIDMHSRQERVSGLLEYAIKM